MIATSFKRAVMLGLTAQGSKFDEGTSVCVLKGGGGGGKVFPSHC